MTSLNILIIYKWNIQDLNPSFPLQSIKIKIKFGIYSKGNEVRTQPKIRLKHLTFTNYNVEKKGMAVGLEYNIPFNTSKGLQAKESNEISDKDYTIWKEPKNSLPHSKSHAKRYNYWLILFIKKFIDLYSKQSID